MSEGEKNDKGAGKKQSAGGLDRRDFIQGLATVPVLGAFLVTLAGKTGKEKPAKKAGARIPSGNLSDINIALLGTGAQGQVLMNSCLKIPGLKFRAV